MKLRCTRLAIDKVVHRDDVDAVYAVVVRCRKSRVAAFNDNACDPLAGVERDTDERKTIIGDRRRSGRELRAIGAINADQ